LCRERDRGRASGEFGRDLASEADHEEDEAKTKESDRPRLFVDSKHSNRADDEEREAEDANAQCFEVRQRVRRTVRRGNFLGS